MWYKNAIIYLLPDGWQLEAGFAEKLEQAERHATTSRRTADSLMEI